MEVILKYAYLSTVALLIVYSLINFRKIKEGGGGYLVLALVLSLLVDLIGNSARKNFNFIWGYNVFTILIFPIYFALLKPRLPERIRPFITYLIVGFLVFGTANFLFFQGMRSFNNYTLLLGAFLLILLSLLYFKSRFDNPHENLLQSWTFWVATGMLLYFTGTLFYFGFIPRFSALDRQWRIYFYGMLQVMNIVMYIMFGIALVCLNRRQTLSQ
ncbi:hypothetical protein TH63_18645 [Rufibacter radiotolerans]|uniref:YhhN-like protein n=1 Tax=Rufibacter radiotolerans TaxID=1379910 RepID=A0A0H4VTE1_9BACT|nr:hypothetical protein [Rufibacter radiotolerans]AKQ47202.1 hypothetical protein TH63_18645 [Rufibacter radiotolerans]